MSKQHQKKTPEKSRRRRCLILPVMALGCAFLLKRDSPLPKK